MYSHLKIDIYAWTRATVYCALGGGGGWGSLFIMHKSSN